MRKALRLVPVALMGSLAVAYMLARPGLALRAPHLTILEFPIGALLVGLLLWMALGRRRATPPPVWRRHAQVVRQLPDPALAPYLGALERWLETGAAPEAAADVLAKARTNDPREQELHRARLLAVLDSKASRRKRESLLKKEIQHGA